MYTSINKVRFITRVFLLIVTLTLITLITIQNLKPNDNQTKEPVYTALSSIVDNYLSQDLIFVVGAVSSGTTLMRLILDVHPDVNCGDETKIVHLIIEFIKDVYKKKFYVEFMKSSRVKNETINKATALFIYYMIENNKKHESLQIEGIKRRLCNKEPFNTYHMKFLHSVFPNARFVFMVRDGRDVAFSQLKRTNKPNTFYHFRNVIYYWKKKNEPALRECQEMGPNYCHIVIYEHLVNTPEVIIRNVTNFLRLSWSDELLHHDRYLNNKNILLSESEVFKAIQNVEINNSSIGKWRGNVEFYDEKFINFTIGALLKQLGYSN